MKARQRGHRYQHIMASSARQSLSPALQTTWSNPPPRRLYKLLIFTTDFKDCRPQESHGDATWL